jgi:hypothetical protein
VPAAIPPPPATSVPSLMPSNGRVRVHNRVGGFRHRVGEAADSATSPSAQWVCHASCRSRSVLVCMKLVNGLQRGMRSG